MSPSIFGHDAGVFRPERFLEQRGAAAGRAEMERTAELAFGSGRWMCAGKLVAFTQLYKAIFELLRRFDIQLVDPARPWEEASAIFWHQANMRARITEAERV